MATLSATGVGSGIDIESLVSQLVAAERAPEAQRLLLNSVEGAGFIGIAVALMGRSHPVGVILASLLFGFLYQGGAELALWTSIPRELITVIQALVILFTGALDNMIRMPVERLFMTLRRGDR